MRGVLIFLILLSYSYAMVFPGSSWQTATPASQGVDAGILDDAMQYMDDNFGGSGADRAVVIRYGYVIWDGPESDVQQHIYSSTKIFTSTVLGLLVDDGLINPDARVNTYLPTIDDTYTAYSNMRVWHLATMSSGYNSVADPDGKCYSHCTCDYSMCEYDLTPGSPLYAPGTQWRYIDDNLRKLAEILVKESGKSLKDNFKEGIADKIDMKNWDWMEESSACDISGVTFNEPTGYCRQGMHISAKDFARLGHLYINNGNWDGEQVLSASYVARATTNQVAATVSCPASYCWAGRYGFYWYVNDLDLDEQRPYPNAPASTFRAHGGQSNEMIVVPEWDMVIVRLNSQTEAMPDNAWNNFFGILDDGIGSVSSQSVTRLDLYDADSDQLILELTNGVTLDLSAYPNINIEAVTSPSIVGSVRFSFDGNTDYRTENSAPYFLAGDNSGDILPLSLSLGSHTVSAVPYSASQAVGTAGASKTVTFTVAMGEGLTETEIDGPMRVWQPVILSFPGPFSSESADSPNPFLDYRLQVRFDGPGSRQYIVPGYFDGDGNGGASGNVWRVKFTPDVAGTWSYTASFRQGDNIAISTASSPGTATSFNGETGSFSISSRDSSALGFLSDGRLVYDGYYMKTLGNDQHWIKGGTDCPENFLAFSAFDNTPDKHYYSAHVGDWKTGDPDWGGAKGIIGALNYLESKNVNSVYFLPMNIGGDGKDVWPYSGAINPAGASSNDNEHFDLSKLKQWDMVFKHAQELGINLHFVLNEAEEANKKELDNALLGTERKLYYRELVARFGYHNALQWNLCEEWDLGYDPGASNVRSWAEYIREVDPYDHPITIHNGKTPEFVIGDSRFDLMSIQYHPGTTNPLYNLPYGDRVEDYRQKSSTRPIPIHMDEPWTSKSVDDMSHTAKSWTFENGISFQRKNLIWPVYLSGGALELVIDDWLGTEDFSKYDMLWDQLWYARKFVEMTPFWEMQPMDNILTGEGRGEYEDGQVFAKAGEVYTVFLPDASPSGTLNIPAGTYTKRWYNPRTGAFSSSSIINGGSVALGSPPSDVNEDWAVLIEATGSTPGDLVGHWTMDDISGSYAIDASGSGNDANIIGASIANGISGDAMSFNSEDYLQVDDSSSLDVGSGDFALAFWVYRESSTERGDLITKKDLYVQPSQHDISVLVRDDYVRVYLKDNSNSVGFASSAPLDAQWTHVAVVRDSGQVSMYINGALSASATFSGDLSSNGPLRIGANRIDDSGTDGESRYTCDCMLDDVRYYSVALSAQEVADLAGGCIPGDYEPCDGCVEIDELVLYLNDWVDGQVDMMQAISAISSWKTGC